VLSLAPKLVNPQHRAAPHVPRRALSSALPILAVKILARWTGVAVGARWLLLAPRLWLWLISLTVGASSPRLNDGLSCVFSLKFNAYH
jgi:hypothetical protein